MLSKTDIEYQLYKKRNKRITPEDLLDEVQQIFQKNELQRLAIKKRIRNGKNEFENSLLPEKLDAERIYHIKDIETICIDYRLRFLDAQYFKGPIPEEAISKIRSLEEEHNCTLNSLKIMAPAKLLKLENADDPLLFTNLENNYYYLIHKWGNDLHPLRKFLMWPYKTFENLIITIFFLSIALTAITPMQAFTKGEVTQTEYLLMFLFMFKAVAGVVLFYGFAKGKNFNTAIWNSKYYNA